MAKQFLVVSGAGLKLIQDSIYGYGPYIKELNLWIKNVDEVIIIAPLDNKPISSIDLKIAHPQIKFEPVKAFSLISLSAIIRTVFLMPKLTIALFFAMKRTDHIHLRTPSNVALLGCFIQIFFPSKPKTAKYAANWDPNSAQPWSYKLQQAILKNTFLTRNMQVLVYGNWPDKTLNIKPFFTATYSNNDIEHTPPRPLLPTEEIRLIYVGTLSKNKKPMLVAQVAKELIDKGLKINLDFYGEGPERLKLETFIDSCRLQNAIYVHGNQTAEVVKRAFQNAHFLVFISRSEGWPKVVAESMFWGCFPITSRVSMVPEMINNGARGALVEPNVAEVIAIIEHNVSNPTEYAVKSQAAMDWSRQYTLEKFETEIMQLLDK